MNRMLYLECAAGISGDMAVAALLDLGANEQRLRAVLASLSIDGFSVEVSRIRKSGLDACDFNVVLDADYDGHDHDMAFLHGKVGVGDSGADGTFIEGHDHGHDDGADDHKHGHHGISGHGHSHRGMPEIVKIIESADMTEGAKEIALDIFGVIAKAEAKAHGVLEDEVHFHEVGAVDSIVDVISFAALFDDLGIRDVVVTKLTEGQGTVRCQHGVLPVPVPAVLNIASTSHIPISVVDAMGELTTPTGAAIVAATRTRSSLPDAFVVEKVGLGAGKRTYETAGILRAMIIREA